MLSEKIITSISSSDFEKEWHIEEYNNIKESKEFNDSEKDKKGTDEINEAANIYELIDNASNQDKIIKFGSWSIVYGILVYEYYSPLMEPMKKHSVQISKYEHDNLKKYMFVMTSGDSVHLSYKDNKIRLLQQCENTTITSTFSKITYKCMRASILCLLNIDKNKENKALLVESTTLRWYIHKKMLILFYKNALDQVKVMCSILSSSGGYVFNYTMENGMEIRITHENDNIVISQTKHRYFCKYKWITPMTTQEIQEYNF